MTSQPQGFSDKVSFIWSVADLLRGDFKAHEYGQVILPFVVLRRLECALAPTKSAVIKRAEGLVGKVDNVDPILRRTAGRRFYNLSPLDLTKLLNDPNNVAANLRTYIAGFSPGAVEVLEKYGFDDKIGRLDRAGLLYQVVGRFAELDLSEAAVTNDTMGYIFEELLRRFSEMSNETAGEHFTPREVIRLMVNILFAPDDAALTGAKPVRTLYDPACGTGGMLTVATEHLRDLNPNAQLEVYGQELNPETWAICRSDLMIKDSDPDRIILGNSLTGEDGHPNRRFDYMLANPPFGVDWKKYAEPIQNEHKALGFQGRYGPGLPRVSDGSMLFLLHMISKMKPVNDDPATPDVIEGGTRLAIVFSGSPLFAGAAGGGESEIRRYVIENDLLEGIVALPDQMFYNTGISTYFWILTNRKPASRAGRIVLVDARDSFTKMRRSLGEKRKTMSDEQLSKVTQLYADALETDPTEVTDKRVKILSRESFGFHRITVERPMRRRWELTNDDLNALSQAKVWISWPNPPRGVADAVGHSHRIEAEQVAVLESLRGLAGVKEPTEAAFRKHLAGVLAGHDVPDRILKAIVTSAATPDPSAGPIVDRKGSPLPDPDLRDTENIPLPEGWLSLPPERRDAALVEQAGHYLLAEIHPYVAEAWIDHSKTRIGYEIPFTKHFYEYKSPRPVSEIDAELLRIEQQIQELLGGLRR